MNIVISGDGEIGYSLAKQLAEGRHNITVVDLNQSLLKMVESHQDILTVSGDSTSIKVLKEAGVNSKTDLLISVVHDEKVNLLTAILGKQLKAKRTIARINNPEYLKNEKLLNNLGIDIVISPEQLAAEQIFKLIEQNSANEVYEFADGKLALFQFKMSKDSAVVGKTLSELSANYTQSQFRVVSILRAGETIIPHGDLIIQINDLCYIICKKTAFDELLNLVDSKRSKMKNIMIIGGGRIGRKTAYALEKADFNVKLIDIDHDRATQLTHELEKTLIINGDARNLDLLEDEGVRDMDAFIAVTNQSETNILSCLLAKKLGVKRVIPLINNFDYIDICQNIGIETYINKRQITANHIECFTLGRQVRAARVLFGVDAEVLELVAEKNSTITKGSICELVKKLPSHAIVGGLIRKNEAYIATGKTQIEEGDIVVVFSRPNSIKKVTKLFK